MSAPASIPAPRYDALGEAERFVAAAAAARVKLELALSLTDFPSTVFEATKQLGRLAEYERQHAAGRRFAAHQGLVFLAHYEPHFNGLLASAKRWGTPWKARWDAIYAANTQPVEQAA